MGTLLYSRALFTPGSLIPGAAFTSSGAVLLPGTVLFTACSPSPGLAKALRAPLSRSPGQLVPTRRRLSGSESETDRLRQENAELKEQLKKQEQKSGSGFDPLGWIRQGVQKLLGRKEDKEDNEDKADRQLSPPVQLPGPLELAGSLLGPIGRFFGGLLQGAKGDVDAVMDAAEAAILRSGRLGTRVKRGAVLSQSYSSIDINGQQTIQVSLKFQVQGESATGLASCSASVSPGTGVEFRDLRLDGSPIDTRSSGAGGGVIDVER